MLGSAKLAVSLGLPTQRQRQCAIKKVLVSVHEQSWRTTVLREQAVVSTGAKCGHLTAVGLESRSAPIIKAESQQ